MKKKINYQQIFQLACATLIFGLLYSRFLISIGMILLLVAGLWEGDIYNKFKSFLKDRYFLALTGIFLLFFISGIWSENIDYFLNRSRIKLPILFLPFAFFAMPKIDKKVMTNIMHFFIGIVVLSVFWSLINYLGAIEHYTKIYSQGQILPTPIHHIRYSIIVAIAVALSLHFAREKFKTTQKFLSPYLYITLFLSIYLHVLAVRSGLLTLYVLFLCLIIFYLLEKGSKFLAISSIVGFMVVVYLSTQFVPTIKNKIGYMKYSIELFSKNENIRDLSDSRRLGSIKAGIDMTKNNPLLGVGIGDVMDETNDYLKNHYPQLADLELLPHNQYILASSTLGILGGLLFILFTIMPFFYLSGYNDFLVFSVQLMMFATFMVEHTIESQIGVAVYIFIILFAMKNRQSQIA